MNLNIGYYFFESALDPTLCDKIIDYGLSLPDKQGEIGASLAEGKITNEHLKKRDSHVAFTDDLWILKETVNFVDKANQKAGWNFNWDYTEASQFTKYKINQHYGWHCDSSPVPFSNPQNPKSYGKVRKLSTVCFLSDPKDYEGGEFEFQFRTDEDPTIVTSVKDEFNIKKGSLLVFPSFLWHRVKPVTKGDRYSLVQWHLGYPYK